MAMSDVAFLMIAISFLMVAFLTAVATNASPKVSRIANRVVYGSCVAALISEALAVWFLFRPLA
jgi:hypothetical protein